MCVYCFMNHIINWNKICKKKYLACVSGKPSHRLCCTTPSGWIFHPHQKHMKDTYIPAPESHVPNAEKGFRNL